MTDSCANDCLSLMATALDQLTRVSKALKTRSSASDVPYWLTAAQDQVTTCLDGFREFSPSTLATPAGKSLQAHGRQTANALYHLAKAAAALKARTDDEDVPFWITAARDQLVTCLDGIWEFSLDTYKSHAGKSLTALGKNLKKSFDTAIALALHSQNLPPRRETLEHGGPGEPPSWVEPAMYERIRELQARMQGDHAEAQAWAERGRKLQLAKVKKLKPNAVVGKNEKYKKISDALKAAPKTGLYEVYIKAGTYKEKVLVNREGVVLVGDGATKTIITGKDSVAGGFTTYNTATVNSSFPAVATNRCYFQAAGIKFENTAGIQGNQAVALMIDADKAVVYDCSVTGYQDTLYTHSGRQYYRNCFISGITDFIFGNAAAVIDNCTIEMRAGKSNIPITASGRETETPTGIVIRFSFVTAEKGVTNNSGYLGRPWKKCARTVYINTFLAQQINKEGWSTWNGDNKGKCVYYAEKDSEGPGAYKPRAKWTANALYHLAKAAAALKARTDDEDGPFWITAARDQLVTCLEGIWEFSPDTYKSHAGKSLTNYGNNLKKSYDTAIALALQSASSAGKAPPRRKALDSSEDAGRGEPPSWVEAGMYERIRELQARMQEDHAEAGMWAERGRKLQLAKVKKLKPNAVVGKNEKYKKISDALKAAPKTGLYVVYIKAGTYKENVLVNRQGVVLEINKEGWSTWNGDNKGKCVYYGEKGSKGPGAYKPRAKWVKPGEIKDGKPWAPEPFIQLSKWYDEKKGVIRYP
ncbi:unnamed protein product [Closterium sp. Naga37s-1]|nr:unnamed protein product [Closterium sp. Naga37s-1]